MDISYRIEGGEELEKLLTVLPIRIERKILIAGLRASAKSIKRQARVNIKARFKSHTGVLQRSIKHRSAKAKSGALLYVEAASGRKAKFDAYYARFLEQGTKYIKASSFLKDALETTREKALNDFDVAVIKAIEKEVIKLR